jgi:peptidoglycan/LPS O-acetylase OafA/YrhL
LNASRSTFWLSRLSRVYPLYFAALLIALPLYVHGALKGRNNITDTVWGLILVPVMLQSWIPRIAIEWNPPAWSLSVEALFYALFPFLTRYVVRWNPKRFLTFSVLLVCVCNVIRGILWRSKLEGVSVLNYNLRNFLLYFPLFHVPSFLVGMGLGKLFINGKRWSPSSATFLFKIFLFVGGVILVARTKLPNLIYEQAFMVLFFSILIYCGAATGVGRVSVLAHPLLIRLGNASYAMYILQAPLSAWFEVLMKSWFKVTNWTESVWLVLVFFLFLVVASIASFEFVEKPCRRLIRQWRARRDQNFGKRVPCSADVLESRPVHPP